MKTICFHFFRWFQIIFKFPLRFSNFHTFLSLFRKCTAGRTRTVAKSSKYYEKMKTLCFQISRWFPIIFKCSLRFSNFPMFFISFQKMHGWEGPSRSKITKILEKLENRVFSCFSLWFPIILQFSSGFSNFPMFFFTLFRTCTAGRIRAVAKSSKI